MKKNEKLKRAPHSCPQLGLRGWQHHKKGAANRAAQPSPPLPLPRYPLFSSPPFQKEGGEGSTANEVKTAPKKGGAHIQEVEPPLYFAPSSFGVELLSPLLFGVKLFSAPSPLVGGAAFPSPPVTFFFDTGTGTTM